MKSIFGLRNSTHTFFNETQYLSKSKYYLLLLIISIFSLPLLAANQSANTTNENIKRLQKGGYVLYIRHAATDHHQQDKDLSDLSQCSLQRNLSQQGKDESRILAKALKVLNINVDEVYTSPYCRCVDTAKIAFGRYIIKNDMRATVATNLKESQHLVNVLRKQLSTKPKKGLNTVLVGHTSNLRELTKVWPKPEGVVHIFEPLGKNGYRHLGHISPTEWGPLANIK